MKTFFGLESYLDMDSLSKTLFTRVYVSVLCLNPSGCLSLRLLTGITCLFPQEAGQSDR